MAVIVFLSLVHGSEAATFNIEDGNVIQLKTAINACNGNHQDDTINLAANGTYVLTSEDNATNGLPVIDGDSGHSLTIIGNGATIMRGTSALFRILDMNDNTVVTLSNLIISDGEIHSSGNSGGGIRKGSGSLTISGCQIINNYADGAGGGISCRGALTIIGGAVSNNRGGGGGGGGISFGGTTLSIDSCTLSENMDQGGNGLYGTGGGALYIDGATSASITSTTLALQWLQCRGRRHR